MHHYLASSARTLRTGLRPTAHRGFSLLELAIALAVVAVLSGGFLKGRELLSSAKVQSLADQIRALETGVASFEARFGALPGDFTNTNGALTTAGGNGDGAVGSTAEGALFFSQLASAGFLRGSFDGVDPSTGSCPASTCPKTPQGGAIVAATGNQARNASDTALELNLGSGLNARQAAELDRKLDDGDPLNGSLRLAALTASNDCLQTNGGWNESTNPVNCTLIYRVR